MPTLVGILNCTPDSFSDGVCTSSSTPFIERGKALLDEGAHLLDIGGDSTRPGSQCVGIKEEWRRIKPILEHFAHRVPCSVDTHYVEIAQRACDHGAKLINDISGRWNEDMIALVASRDVKYIFMFNAHGDAHTFGEGLPLSNAFTVISQWITITTSRLIENGVAPSKLIADPGIGAFVSRDPAVSFEIIERFGELPMPPGGLLLGCSRKGFLATPSETSPRDRDRRSCLAGALAASQVPTTTPMYLRIHNVAMQHAVLSEWQSLTPNNQAIR